MLRFELTSVLDAPVDAVFDFHEQPDALERLSPPWPPIQVLRREGGIREGGRVVLVMGWGPLRLRWEALHTRYVKHHLFVDVQESGPFRSWVHRHQFENLGETTRLTDRIEFSLPGGAPIDFVCGWAVLRQLRRMFRWRHEQTAQWTTRLLRPQCR